MGNSGATREVRGEVGWWEVVMVDERGGRHSLELTALVTQQRQGLTISLTRTKPCKLWEQKD